MCESNHSKNKRKLTKQYISDVMLFGQLNGFTDAFSVFNRPIFGHNQHNNDRPNAACLANL